MRKHVNQTMVKMAESHQSILGAIAGNNGWLGRLRVDGPKLGGELLHQGVPGRDEASHGLDDVIIRIVSSRFLLRSMRFFALS